VSPTCHQAGTASRGVALPFRVFVRIALAPSLVECSPPALGSRWAPGFSRVRHPNKLIAYPGILSWASALLQSAPSSSGRRESPAIGGETTTAPPMRFFAPTASPRSRQRHEVIGFASPDRLHLQVFSTSWRFHPPRACRPCFMPDPLMGFHPPELSSSRAAVRRLRRHYPPGVWRKAMSIPLSPVSRIRKNVSNQLPEHPVQPLHLQGLAPHESPPHTHGCLDREQHVALLGFRPPGSSPSLEWPGLHRASPHGLGPTARTRPIKLPSRVSLPAR
jgi:hypothetical protein